MELTRLAWVGLAVSALGCGSTVVRGQAPEGVMYIVVHPSDGPGLPGIYEYDVGNGVNAIERFDIADGSRRRIGELAYVSQSRSALTFDGARLVTVDTSLDLENGRRDRNALRWIDPVSGATVDQRPISVRGWVTAIAARVV